MPLLLFLLVTAALDTTTASAAEATVTLAIADGQLILLNGGRRVASLQDSQAFCEQVDGQLLGSGMDIAFLGDILVAGGPGVWIEQLPLSDCPGRRCCRWMAKRLSVSSHMISCETPALQVCRLCLVSSAYVGQDHLHCRHPCS